jgi:hypothetical protein
MIAGINIPRNKNLGRGGKIRNLQCSHEFAKSKREKKGERKREERSKKHII